MKKYLTYFLIALLLMNGITVYCADYSPINGGQHYGKAKLFTPNEYIFQIEGSDEEFILLDVTSDKQSKYMVLTKTVYPPKIFDTGGSQIFDPNNQKNIAHYLNNEFLASDTLPQMIKDHINKSHVWTTESGSVNYYPEGETKAVAGVVLLSLREFNKYYEKIGYRDQAFTPWFLRTPMRFWSKDHVYGVDASSFICKVTTYHIGEPNGIRPVFYLDYNFFLDAKINIVKSGAAVKRAISREYSKEMLEGVGFSKEYIEDIFAGEKFEFYADSDNSKIMHPENAAYRYKISANKFVGETYDIFYGVTDLYRNENIEFTSIKDSVSGGIEKSGKLLLYGLAPGIYRITISVSKRGRTIYEYSDVFSILKPYTSQLLDKYNMRGFSVQWERVMYPEYIDKQVDALSKAGIKYARSSSSWAGFESGSNKTINYARSAMWIPKLYANGISHILMLSYNNTLYADKIMSGIVSKDNTIAYGDYAKAMLEKYPHIKTVEIWNEPDMNGFWIGNTPGENYTDYTDLLKYTSTELNKYRNDINIIGGVIAQTWTTDMLSGMLQNGAYGYMDSVSVHGYNYPNRIDEEFFEKRFVTHKNLLSEYGGWKRLIITEIGAPTGTGQSSVSEKDQARDVIMSYLLTDKFGLDGCMVYVLTNPGIKENDREAMFGVLRNTFEPKPAYIAVNQMNSALGGALYIGDIMLGEHVTAGVYHNNGVPLMVVWNKTKNNVETIAVPEDIVEIKDLLGKNVTVKDNITVGSEVYYLYDVKREYLSKAALNSVTHINQNLGEYKIHFGNYDLLDKEGILSALRLIADTAENLIQSVKNGIVDMEQARLSQILFEYHNMMKIFVNLYSAVANDTSLTEVSDYYSMAKEFIDDRKSQEQTDSLMYSEAMLKYAKQYYDNANDLLNSHENGEIKNSVINIWNYAGDIISKWAYDFCQLESGNNLKVYLKVPGENLKFYEEATQSLPVYIVNNGCNDFTGEVQLLDDKGNIVAKSMRVHSYSNQWKQINVDFDENNVPESGLYTLCFVDGSNKVITQKNLKINVVKSISVELLPSDNTIDKLDHINVKVNNLSNKTLTGNVSIIPPSGWSLSNSQITYTVAGNSSEIYSFKVNQKTAYAYNHYVFDIAVTNLQGKQILNVESPLSFTCIIAAQQPIDVYAFDGNIEEWSDAYPIYIQPVSKPNDIDLWTKSELSGRAFIKWDKDNLYVMCDVYDEFFAQTESEGRIWNGDSIQVAIDAQNDKANKYMPDDLEIGLALTDYGVQTYVWHGVNDDAVGSRSPSYGNVVRSNEKSITRYCMRIPKEELGLKEFTENMQIGFNLVINDSDLNTREGYAEFTAGTVSGKNPSLWYTFNLCRPETNVIRLDMTVFPKSF